MSQGRRHLRQMRLIQVGVAGQDRITGSIARLRSRGFAAEVEARYLAGAGVGELCVHSAHERAAALAVDASLNVVESGVDIPRANTIVPPLPSFIAALDPDAREVAEGAYRALEHLRQALEHAT